MQSAVDHLAAARADPTFVAVLFDALFAIHYIEVLRTGIRRTSVRIPGVEMDSGK